jgi:hypothetical protein
MVDEQGNEYDIANALTYKGWQGMVYAKYLKCVGNEYHFHYWTKDSDLKYEQEISFKEYAEAKIVCKPDGSIKAFARIRKPFELPNNNYGKDTWCVSDAECITKGMIDYAITMEAEKAIFNTETIDNQIE